MAIGQSNARAAATADIVARVAGMPLTHAHRRICGTLAFGNFFDSFDSLILAVAITAIAPALHFGFVDIGLLLSAAFFGMTIGSLFFGWLAEIVGRKPVVVWTIAGFGVMSIAAAFAWNFDSLMTIRVIQGLALGGEVPVVGVLFTEFLPGKSRARIFLYYFTVLFSLGIFLAPLTGLTWFLLLGPALGWHALFLTGGLALPVALLVHFVAPESPRWLAEKGRLAEADAIVSKLEGEVLAEGKALPGPLPVDYVERPTKLGELFQGIYTARTILVWTQFFTTYFVMHGITVWLPTLYVRVGGLPANAALGLATIFGAVLLLVVFFWGQVADKMGRKLGFVVGYSCCIGAVAIGSFSIGVLHVTGWPVLFVVSLLAGLGMTFNAAMCFLYTAELYPTRMRAWASATGGAANRIGSFVAPTAIGAVLAANLGIDGVIVMLGVVALIGLLATLWLAPETSSAVLEAASA